VSYGRYASHKTIVCIQVTDYALGRSQRLEYNSKPPTDAEFRNFAFAQPWVMFLPGFFESGNALVCFDKGIVRIEQVKRLAVQYCTPYVDD
jgi:hypothetical protein